MCHTTETQDMPLNVPGSGSSDPFADVSAPGVVGGTASTHAITARVKKPTKFGRALEFGTMGAYDPTGGEDTTKPPSNGQPTKIGTLLNILRPILAGGAAGEFSGKGHPGGGFGAANDFFMQQREQQVRNILLQNQMQNDSFRNMLEAARTQHTLQQPNFAGAGARPISGLDEDGNPIYMRPNPVTGVYEPVEGITPNDNDSFTPQMTDQGLVSFDKKKGSVKRVTLPTSGPGAATAQPSAEEQVETTLGSKKPSRFDSGSPKIPLSPAASPAGISRAASGVIPTKPGAAQPPQSGGATSPPLMPADRHNDTLKEKAADSLRTKHPDWDDALIDAEVEAAGRKPDKSDDPDMSPKEYRSRQSKLSNQLNNDFRAQENKRQNQLAALQKRQDLTPEEMEQQRQQIEEQNADEKQTLHQRAIDNATAQGIDLGEVPDYRAGLGGGGTAAPTGGNASQPKAQHKIGDVVTYKGKQYKIKGIKNGQAQLGPAQ